MEKGLPSRPSLLYKLGCQSASVALSQGGVSGEGREEVTGSPPLPGRREL